MLVALSPITTLAILLSQANAAPAADAGVAAPANDTPRLAGTESDGALLLTAPIVAAKPIQLAQAADPPPSTEPPRAPSPAEVQAQGNAAPATPPAMTGAAGPNAPGQPATTAAPDPGIAADDALIDGRRRPGVPQDDLPERVVQDNPGAVRPPPPEAFPTQDFPIPDRWRLIQTLGIVKERWFDPYNQNTYKGDRPLCLPTDEVQEQRKEAGKPRCATPKFLHLKTDEWFLALNATSDTVIEPRTFPIPVGIQYPVRPGSNDVFGKNWSQVFAQTFIFGASLIKGSTAYKPPEVEWRAVFAYNVNHVAVPERRVLYIQPTKGRTRTDAWLGVQEFFLDYHLHNSSDRYDFHSVRVGIQPFNFDFRGFLFQDQQLGVRLFGNRDDNRFQYNLAVLWRLNKDTNSGLNDITKMPRDDLVFHGNLYRQDFPVPGITSEVSVTYNMNRERGEVEVDDNGFPVRPALIGNLQTRNYDIVYLGYAAEGRLGRMNVSLQTYGALGSDRNNVFTGRKAQVRSWFAAFEPSYDTNWMRFRGSFLFASGDNNPFNNRESGFDAIFENPIFAGADTSYWIRQTIPFIGGGRVISINGRNGILNTLRSSKEEGQSNFANPGTILAGAGADFDLTPRWRVSANVNHLWFDKTGTLQALRSEGSIPKAIGWDMSAATIWRPKFTQNLVFRLSGAVLAPGAGFKDLFENRQRKNYYYSVLFNAVLNY